MKGSDIIINCLIRHDVDTVFGYPGGNVIDIYDSLYNNKEKITHYITSHEQGASHCADGYARATGKVGVVIATSGPGATNLCTGIATAFMDSIPLVVITGNVPLSLLGRDSFQEVDITGMTMPITKQNYIVKTIGELEETINEAFYLANSGRKGPVLIDVPKNIQLEDCEVKNLPISTFKPKQVDTSTINDAITLIEKSKRPLIYAGGGIISSNASLELEKFADLIDAPVSCSLMGISAFPADNKRYLGGIGMHGSRASAYALASSDLVIAIGSRFSDRVATNRTEFNENKKVIHIDIDCAEIDKNVSCDAYLIADAKMTLNAFNKVLKQQNHTSWLDKVLSVKNNGNYISFKNPDFNPEIILRELNEISSCNDIVVTDVGQHQMWTAQFYKFETPRTFLTSGGLGTMGFGLGAAIGAFIGTRKHTTLITGDGSFHMNLNELATAVKYNVPLTIILMNNNALGMVRQLQKLFTGRRFSETTLDRKTDYVALAKAFGGNGEVVMDLPQLKNALKRAKSSTVPYLLDCKIDIDDNVLPMIPSSKTTKDIILNMDN